MHHHLIETRQRMKVGLILETAEAREVHHMCVLLGNTFENFHYAISMNCININESSQDMVLTRYVRISFSN